VKKIDDLILQCLDIIGENISEIQKNPMDFGIREGKMISEYLNTLIRAKKIEEEESSELHDIKTLPTDELVLRAKEILEKRTKTDAD